jgi:hypothetical protein
LKRKASYDSKEKQKTILLIDTWPSFDQSVVDPMPMKLYELIKNLGYKEIWLVGSVESFTFRIG